MGSSNAIIRFTCCLADMKQSLNHALKTRSYFIDFFQAHSQGGTCTVVPQKRVHCGLSAHPPVLAQFPAGAGSIALA